MRAVLVDWRHIDTLSCHQRTPGPINASLLYNLICELALALSSTESLFPPDVTASHRKGINSHPDWAEKLRHITFVPQLLVKRWRSNVD